MKQYLNVITAYLIMFVLIILVGILQSWSLALTILNYCLISAVMTIGANIQWGYAGLINFGIMGYTALGGLAVVLVSVAPVGEAWSVGGLNMMICLGVIIGIVFSIRLTLKKIAKSKKRNYLIAAIIIIGILLLIDKPLAKLAPTIKAPFSPGPFVTAIASIALIEIFDSIKAFSATLLIR